MSLRLPRRTLVRLQGLLWAFLLMGVSLQAFAQVPGADGPAGRVQSLSVTRGFVDFRYDGDGTPISRFDFDRPTVGLAYSRPNLRLSVSGGRNTAPPGDSLDLGLLDVSFTTWGEYRLVGERGSPYRLFVPIVLHSSFRRVSYGGNLFGETSTEAFGVTSLGLGTGLGAVLSPTPHMRLESRVTPIAALATRSFGESTGSTWILDADAALVLPRIFGRFGLSAGYSYRLQRWNVNASDLLATRADNYFDYLGRMHVVRLGVNW